MRYLITNLSNVSYLTGFSGSSGFVLATPGRAWFMTDSRYETQSADEVSGYEVVIQKRQVDPGDCLAGA